MKNKPSNRPRRHVTRRNGNLESRRWNHSADTSGADPAPSERAAVPLIQPESWSIYGLVAAVLAVVFAFAYAPALVELWELWSDEPDYSHGMLVPLIAGAFLYMRRDAFPGVRPQLAWGGLVLIAISIALRVVGAVLFVTPLDGWSMVFWVGGCVWMLMGWPAFRWALPAIAFLFFAVRLPYRVETMLSVPLQSLATSVSCWVLQLIGQPAIAEGNIIRLGEQQMGVEEACSGLRIFVGIVALAFAYLLFVRRTWWERAIILAAVIPIAVVANSTRVVVTCLLYRYTVGDFAHKFSHDFAGWVMIPYAAILFALLLAYLNLLFPTIEQMDVGGVVRNQRRMRAV